MGYHHNHLAILVCAVFASVLTLLWPMCVDYADVYDVIFILSVPIMWFLTIFYFVAHRSEDYMHGHKPSSKSTKKPVYIIIWSQRHPALAAQEADETARIDLNDWEPKTDFKTGLKNVFFFIKNNLEFLYMKLIYGDNSC